LKIRIVLIFLLCNIVVISFAQKPKVKNDPTHDDKPIHFGFSLGLNMMDYRIEFSQLALGDHVFIGLHEVIPGINIHAIANLRLADNFDLRALPGISFGERYMYFKSLSSDTAIIYPYSSYKVESSYLELPLLLKYKSKRLNNFRPYLIGGGNFRYDLAIKKEYDMEEQLLMIKPFNIYGEIGMGIDFYLTYFKLGTEIKYSFGLSDILLRNDRHGQLPVEFANYTNYIENLTSHIVIISFHFE
jgi:hypothetical protein